MKLLLSFIHKRIDSLFGFRNKFSSPPPLLEVAISDKKRTFVIKVPKREVYRVNNIIYGQEYSILENRSHSGQLTVFDVGANLRFYTLYVKLQHPDSTIFCFEPVPSTFALLQEIASFWPTAMSFPASAFSTGTPRLWATSTTPPLQKSGTVSLGSVPENAVQAGVNSALCDIM